MKARANNAEFRLVAKGEGRPRRRSSSRREAGLAPFSPAATEGPAPRPEPIPDGGGMEFDLRVETCSTEGSREAECSVNGPDGQGSPTRPSRPPGVRSIPRAIGGDGDLEYSPARCSARLARCPGPTLARDHPAGPRRHQSTARLRDLRRAWKMFEVTHRWLLPLDLRHRPGGLRRRGLPSAYH